MSTAISSASPNWSRRRDLAVGIAWAALALPALAQTLTLGRQEEPTVASDISTSVVAEAFTRAGLGLAFKRLPLMRSIEAANDGDIDGNLHRIAAVTARYPNLVLVPTPVNRLDIAIYARTPDIAKRSRAEIAGMKLGYPRGTFALAKYSEGLRAVEAPSRSATLEMLRNERFDAAMMPYVDVEPELIDGRVGTLYVWPYVWASEPLYLILNRRHAALVPQLDAALQEMKREGLIEKYYEDALHRRRIRPLKTGVGR